MYMICAFIGILIRVYMVVLSGNRRDNNNNSIIRGVTRPFVPHDEYVHRYTNYAYSTRVEKTRGAQVQRLKNYILIYSSLSYNIIIIMIIVLS